MSTVAKKEMSIKDFERQETIIDEKSDDEEFDFFLEPGEDAIGRFGYGMVSYFTLIKLMTFYFFFLSLAYFPLMLNYAQWKTHKSQELNSLASDYSLGSLGDNQIKCINTKLVSDYTYI